MLLSGSGLPDLRQLGEYLGERVGPGQTEALLAATEHSVRAVRLVALRALGEVGGVEEIDRLRALTRHSDPETQQAARQAIDMIDERLLREGSLSAQTPPPPPAPPGEGRKRRKKKAVAPPPPPPPGGNLAAGDLSTPLTSGLEVDVRSGVAAEGSFPAIPPPAAVAETVSGPAGLPPIPNAAALPEPLERRAQVGAGVSRPWSPVVAELVGKQKPHA
jgi:hypothetical protein